MISITYLENSSQSWVSVCEGVEKMVLRVEPGENRVLLRIAAGRVYPSHEHAVPDEVFVLEGIYTDAGIEAGNTLALFHTFIIRQEQSTTPAVPQVARYLSGTPVFQKMSNRVNKNIYELEYGGYLPFGCIH